VLVVAAPLRYATNLQIMRDYAAVFSSGALPLGHATETWGGARARDGVKGDDDNDEEEETDDLGAGDDCDFEDERAPARSGKHKASVVTAVPAASSRARPQKRPTSVSSKVSPGLNAPCVHDGGASAHGGGGAGDGGGSALVCDTSDPSALLFRVNSATRAEVYDIVTEVLTRPQRLFGHGAATSAPASSPGGGTLLGALPVGLPPWAELPSGLGLGTTWNLLWTWSKPRIAYGHLLTVRAASNVWQSTCA